REQQRDEERRQPHARHGDPAPRHVRTGVARIDRAHIGAEGELGEIGQDDLQPEGDQQRVEQSRADDEIEHEALQPIAEHEHHRHGDRQRGERIDSQAGEKEIDAIAAQHDERAMRKIDDVEHAPNQRHAERHEAIETAQEHAVDEELQEEHGAALAPMRRALPVRAGERITVPSRARWRCAAPFLPVQRSGSSRRACCLLCLTETGRRFKPPRRSSGLQPMDDRKLLVRRDDVGGIAVLTIDNPPVNATSHALRVALKATLEAALAEPPTKAVLLLGAGRGFIAGADIAEFDRPRLAPLNPAIIAVMEASAVPVIAAIHGHALGGGLELAMGSHYRVATQEARLGQPEVKIGLIPGAGGTQRLPRLVGLPLALEMIAGGDPIGAKAALEAGLIDAIIAGELRAGAIAFAEKILREGRALTRVRDRAPPAPPDADFFSRARADLARRKPALEAPRRAIDALEAALLPFDEGLALEAAIFAETVTSSQSKALRHLFFAERDGARSAAIPAGTPARAVERVAVIGGGTMGSAIAICCADAGLSVTLIESDGAALGRAQAALRRHYEASARRGLAAAEIEHRLSAIAGTTALEEARAADLVIEAVTEDLSLKQRIFTALDRITKPDAILASNTSYLDLDELAAATGRADLVLGLHFFSPATIMRAMEVVRAAKTSAAALATGMALGRKIRKLPVVVGACDGFVGNRLLTQRGRELERLLAEGATIEA